MGIAAFFFLKHQQKLNGSADPGSGKKNQIYNALLNNLPN
jgi:hypothetical protein